MPIAWEWFIFTWVRMGIWKSGKMGVEGGM